ncbi:hypothetical protein CEXT_305971 [Caerostris extrusa]|uniref:Uncharacterized protein n=1 Tax=Caerostris extrusa TaxID=172846 RepID=A0AAV4U3W9_CAEEX|nr:hypothetical protein CEXT_305971 [Caerostris extrusa]
MVYLPSKAFLYHLMVEKTENWRTCALLPNAVELLWRRKTPVCYFVSKIEIQHLMKYLSYSIHYDEKSMMENNTNDYYREWKTEFYPVAAKLLKLLQIKNSTSS